MGIFLERKGSIRSQLYNLLNQLMWLGRFPKAPCHFRFSHLFSIFHYPIYAYSYRRLFLIHKFILFDLMLLTLCFVLFLVHFVTKKVGKETIKLWFQTLPIRSRKHETIVNACSFRVWDISFFSYLCGKDRESRRATGPNRLRLFDNNISHPVVQVAKSLVIRVRAVTTVSDSRRASDTYSPALLWGEAQRLVFRYDIYG